jgi:hypothetical protein
LPLDLTYVRFCQPDNDFYDITESRRENDFPLASEQLPAGWRRQFAAPWVAVHPERTTLAEQGWKIHVTAQADNAAEVLATVWRHCRERGIHFKFLRSAERLREANSKYADRGSSGKFIIIYPAGIRSSWPSCSVRCWISMCSRTSKRCCEDRVWLLG